jgi:hypothetical protein
MTVMPMIMNTQYREFVNVSRGAKFAADAGDLHNALGQFIIAINKDSQRVRAGHNFMQMMTPGSQMEALGWLGNYVTVYVEDDPFWDELAKAKSDDLDTFMRKNIGRIPLALQADVSSGLKLTGFLVAMRAFVNQTAPNMTNWETLTYKDQPYVKITPTETARSQEEHLENLAVYYSASGESLLVTLIEDMLKHSIDRRLARAEAKKKGDKPPEIEHPWLGQNVALTVDNKLIRLAAALMSQSRRPSQMQAASWNNLPILNEWKRRYPNEDPVKLHARFWNINLACPGGGNYVWNEKWQTMESTVYGHPGEPKDGPILHPFFQFLERADFGLTFEEQGLRAKASLTKEDK